MPQSPETNTEPTPFRQEAARTKPFIGPVPEPEYPASDETLPNQFEVRNPEQKNEAGDQMPLPYNALLYPLDLEDPRNIRAFIRVVTEKIRTLGGVAPDHISASVRMTPLPRKPAIES